MATLSLTIFKAKVLKDGRHKIRISVRHKHETCYIITNFIVEEKQFRNGQVIKRPDAAVINTKLRNLLNTYQDRLDNIVHPELYSCKQLKEMIQYGDKKDTATFKSISDEFIRQLTEEGRSSYAKMIEHNSRTFLEFCKGDIPIQGVTPELIDGYIKFLKKKGTVSDSSINIMLARTKVIINRAIKQRLVKYDVHPFISCKISSAPVREADLTLQAFNKIRNYITDERRLRVARDIFLLSFYLGGINMIDMMNLDFRKEEVEYVRTKSRNTTQGVKKICFTLPEPAKAIAAVWMNKHTGKLDFGYKFSYENFVHYVTRSLQKLAAELNIQERVIFYSARKSFAQYACEIGIPDSIIDYCLGHSDKSKGVIRYYTKILQKQADMAISRVIDYVNNPDKYKEYIELRSDIMMMRG